MQNYTRQEPLPSSREPLGGLEEVHVQGLGFRPS